METASLKILIVEDESAHAEALRRTIAASGIASDIAVVGTLSNYDRTIRQAVPDIVLMDYRLPDGSALEVLVPPAESGPFPVLLMTSQGTEEIAVQALKSGAIDYVVKSSETFAFMPQKISAVMREWALIRERKRYQEELREAKDDWERTFDSVPDPIAIVNGDCTIRRINQAMATCLALNGIGSPIGATCYSIFHQIDTALPGCPHQRLKMSGGSEEHMEVSVFGRIYDMSVTPFRDPSGSIAGSIHLFHDVSERKEAEATLIDLERKLQQAQKMEAVGQLAGGVAHDFNNIMQVIAGNSQLLKMMGAVSDAGIENLKEIEAAIERGASLTRGLLTFSRHQVKEFTIIDLNQLVVETFSLARKLVTEEFDFRLEQSGTTLAVMGDKSLLQQVIFNLVTNSRDAISGHGTITLRTGVSSSLETSGLDISDGKYAFISIQDSGCGMSQETREKAFEPFFTTKDVGKGTGLGLAMAYGTASQHGGCIKIETNPGDGCTVTLFIPLASEKPATEIVRHEKLFQGKGETILLAEDEESVRNMMQIILEKAGYDVIPATDGEQAAELFSQHSEIHFVILDAVMPKLSGLGALEKIRALRPGIPYLLLSGYAVDLPEAKTIATDRLLNKPVHPLKLLRSIRHLLLEAQSGKGDTHGTNTID